MTPLTIRIFCFAFTLLLFGCTDTSLSDRPITLDELMIEVFESSREVAYTNKQSGFFYTETNGEHRSSWQGWHIMSTKMMEDYRLFVDGKELRKSDVHLAMVYPHQLHRAYPVGVQESVTLLDSLDAIIVELKNAKGSSLSVRPLFQDSQNPDDFILKFEDNVLLVARKRHPKRTPEADYPVWIGVTAISGQETPSHHLLSESIKERFSPAAVRVAISSASATVLFVAGDTEAETVTRARSVASEHQSMIAQRKERMERLLNHAFVRTDNERFDKALHWAMISMDALIMNQHKKGIFAGLPWFSNYWGRDSFISLPGATLVTGRFTEAREILRSFAEWQQTDPKSPDYGRVPNIVTTSSKQYNTADGTPWFCISLYEYFKYSGDSVFAREMYPMVKRSIEGTLQHRVDTNYFLTHGDAETWMDAVGPDGPWSPRGDRACDIQALWYQQLRVGAKLAQMALDETSSNKWDQIASSLRKNFAATFVDPQTGLLYDHLNSDGTPDDQLRPNQLFATTLLERHELSRIFKAVTEKLVYPHGVASLSQDDENFHPYHHYQPYYVQDASYHNGIVWTWLAGAWIDLAMEFDRPNLAWQVTENMIHQILYRGAVGTLSELLDAAPRPAEKEPRLSGTFTQAWSLAEFIRVSYQDFLGIAIDAPNRVLRLAPNFPPGVTKGRVNLSVGSSIFQYSFSRSDRRAKVQLVSPPMANSLMIVMDWKITGTTTQRANTWLPSNKQMTINLDEEKVSQTMDGVSGGIQHTVLRRQSDAREKISLATPILRTNLKSLKGPSHRLLTNAETKATNAEASVLYDADDPVGDDKGTGSYTYPLTPYLKPGSLDLKHFTVKTDDRNVYFRLEFGNLSNPGWHPEYGFQLTFAAIAIDKDGKAGSGQRNIGMNSQYILERKDAFENIVYIGGGFRVADVAGKILAEYLPVEDDVKMPLGSTTTKSIEFAVPVEILGKPDRSWRFVVLIGAQDDHGGAGVGDFRSVEVEAKEWVGGGKKRLNDPNVYDVILPRK